jgi:hypothetical protein
LENKKDALEKIARLSFLQEEADTLVKTIRSLSQRQINLLADIAQTETEEPSGKEKGKETELTKELDKVTADLEQAQIRGLELQRDIPILQRELEEIQALGRFPEEFNIQGLGFGGGYDNLFRNLKLARAHQTYRFGPKEAKILDAKGGREYLGRIMDDYESYDQLF